MKKNSVLTCLLITILLFSNSIIAQQTSIPNVLSIKSIIKTGSIIENEELIGYYTFYFKEKNDRKTSTYEVQIFDNDYNGIRNFEITRPKNSRLLETNYNGNAFLLFFYDRKTGYELISLDKNGEELGTIHVPIKSISKAEVNSTNMTLSSGTATTYIRSTGKTGFIRQTFIKNKKQGFEIAAYDNELSELWKYSSSSSSELIETISISDVTDNLITATVSRKKSLMTKKADLSFIILDAESGEMIKESSMGSKSSGKESILKAYTSEEEGKIILIGEYYNPGDDILKDKSQGLSIKELDMDGEELNANKYSWNGDLKKFKQDAQSSENIKDAKMSYSIFFHNVVRAENGHLYLIGEQYRKQISAGAIAGKLAAAAINGAGGSGSSNTAITEIRIADMVIIELDQNRKLIDYKIIDKKNNSVMLPQGMGLYGSAFLGYYVNYTGGFDYSFSTNNIADDEFTIVYKDRNKKESKGSKKSDIMIGLIQIKNGEIENSRIPMNFETNYWAIYPAKSGNIAVHEYYRKEKKYDMYLEKIAY